MVICLKKVENEKSYEEVAFERAKNDINNMSYWLPKVLHCGIKNPKTTIIPLTLSQFEWFVSDNYSEEAIAEMGAYLKGIIEEYFDTSKPLFLKTGRFSNKFDFESCKLTDAEKVGEKFLEIFYASMVCGAGNNSELVVREFIGSKEEIPTIYNGMALNTEFRAFYDFNQKKCLGVFNYWDTETMMNGLARNVEFAYDKNAIEQALIELESFKNYAPVLEKQFEDNKDNVKDLVEKHLVNVAGLEGIWSIDLMLVDGEYYLIDMAVGEQSYYYNRLNLG